MSVRLGPAAPGAFTTLTHNTPAVGDSSTNSATTAFVGTATQGSATIAITSGTTSRTLTAAEYSVPIQIVTGALTANVALIVPNTGIFTLSNRTTGAFTVTVKTAAGTGYVVPQGVSSYLMGDGTNVVGGRTDFNAIAVTNSTVNSTPIGATSASTGAFTTLSATTPVAIASGGTGASTAAAALTALGAAPLDTPTFTGTFTSTGINTIFGSNAGASSAFVINAATATFRNIRYYTAGTARWDIGVGNQTEAGSNAGSDFTINCFTDAGAYLNSPITIVRSTGFVTIGSGAAISGGYANSFTVGATTAAAGTFTTLTSTGYHLRSTATGLTAAGTTQATALALTKQINVISTAAASSGVALPNGGIGAEYVVINRGANTMNIYPPTGGNIDALAANAATTTATLTTKRFVQATATQYYTI